MHALYTLAVVVLAVVLSPWFLYQAVRYRKYIGSLTQRMGRLPVSFNLDGDESIWIHAVSVGEALMVRALVGDLRERYPHLKVFLSTTTLTGQQIAKRIQGVDGVFFFPFDLSDLREPDASAGSPAAVHHDGDRDLAEPARALPAAGDQDHSRERPDFVAVLSAVPAGSRVLPSGARGRRSALHAERRVGAPHHRHRRRSRRA